MQAPVVPPNLVQFPGPQVAGRNIPREIADKVAELSHNSREGSPITTRQELAEIILVAIGTYREAVGR